MRRRRNTPSPRAGGVRSTPLVYTIQTRDCLIIEYPGTRAAHTIHFRWVFERRLETQSTTSGEKGAAFVVEP